jgi:hypothetical protein
LNFSERGHPVRLSAKREQFLRYEQLSALRALAGRMPALHEFALKINNLVIVRFQLNRVIDPIDHIAAVPGQQRGDIDVAFLQCLFRIQEIKSAFYLTMNCLVAAYLGAIKPHAQAIDLLIDFAPALLQGLG